MSLEHQHLSSGSGAKGGAAETADAAADHTTSTLSFTQPSPWESHHCDPCLLEMGGRWLIPLLLLGLAWGQELIDQLFWGFHGIPDGGAAAGENPDRPLPRGLGF
ncbi:MAG: hypothetical protein CM15mP77_2110 [Synechococcus sp.]|nr:MAG: hypothetical protein CM15mP77_2110 [Synechococcus sp.]